MIETAEAYGLRFAYPALDTAVGASLRDYGEFARVELDLLLGFARASSGALLDVGANIGALCLPFAAQRPSWNVVGLEAHPGLARVLAENAARNGLTNVTALNLVAGPRTGPVEYPAPPLSLRGNYGDLGLHLPPQPTRRVSMAPIDAIAPPDTRVVKIDVQGFEPQVLEGARRLLREGRPVWVVEAVPINPAATRQVIEAFRSEGYRLHWFYSPFATPHCVRGVPEETTRGDSSIVALPEGVADDWGLPELDATNPTRPASVCDYPYLSRYGY